MPGLVQPVTHFAMTGEVKFDLKGGGEEDKALSGLKV